MEYIAEWEDVKISTRKLEINRFDCNEQIINPKPVVTTKPILSLYQNQCLSHQFYASLLSKNNFNLTSNIYNQKGVGALPISRGKFDGGK